MPFFGPRRPVEARREAKVGDRTDRDKRELKSLARRERRKEEEEEEGGKSPPHTPPLF